MMVFSVRKGDLTKEKADVLVVNVFAVEEGALKFGGATEAVDKALKGLLMTVAKEDHFKGKLGETLFLRTHGQIPAKRVLLIGLGKKEDFSEEVVREVAAASLNHAEKIGAKSVVSVLHGAGGGKLAPKVGGKAMAEGVRLASYIFDEYKKQKSKPHVQSFTIVSNDARDAAQAGLGATVGELNAKGTMLARHLVNMPSGHMQPATLVEVAKRIAKESKGAITIKVYDQAALKKMGAGGILGISQGSDHPPVMVHLVSGP